MNFKEKIAFYNFLGRKNNLIIKKKELDGIGFFFVVLKVWSMWDKIYSFLKVKEGILNSL